MTMAMERYVHRLAAGSIGEAPPQGAEDELGQGKSWRSPSSWSHSLNRYSQGDDEDSHGDACADPGHSLIEEAPAPVPIGFRR